MANAVVNHSSGKKSVPYELKFRSRLIEKESGVGSGYQHSSIFPYLDSGSEFYFHVPVDREASFRFLSLTRQCRGYMQRILVRHSQNC